MISRQEWLIWFGIGSLTICDNIVSRGEDGEREDWILGFGAGGIGLAMMGEKGVLRAYLMYSKYLAPYRIMPIRWPMKGMRGWM